MDHQEFIAAEKDYIHKKHVWVQKDIERRGRSATESLNEWREYHTEEEECFTRGLESCNGENCGAEVDRAGKLHINSQDMAGVFDCGFAYIGAR
mmetsp:Transcript_39718/g.112691  ORF Transcript_39718/g.112691 Transcript_39718/m.112691 type:complete len:94 (+) Transcript_39718:163-444(+)|eukprot:CAMPEP_0117662006 /NCGR_PEP_ID=MMETSP0804-20121206/7832_1 /TAXON_ID=1074897 /ORGANISM="Tetraselmis astigmatica, Strain CCMP880" /LENGTH=93 /DNA_ID=CAMNT_0005468895 /DNA_START=80 /DNA_END=361 /DNA_ORIENTATION=+